MHTLLALTVSAFVICFILTPIVRDLFVRADILDRPDTGRKLHARAVPRAGGIPIVLGYAGALGLLFAFHPGRGLYIQHHQLLHGLLPAAAVIFIVGLLDDILGLRPWQKLLGQSAAAVLAVLLGVQLSFNHLPGWLSMAISVVWLIACTNAVNLIDGMDGLATGVGLFATLTTLAFALLNHNFGLALVTAPLAGCLLAFLRYNFSPATVFLGDCGSLTIGFVLGCFSLVWSQHAGNMLGIAAPLMALSLPLLDVLVAISRRSLRNAPIFGGDHRHIHHMIMARGLSPRRASLLLYGFCGLTAVLAMLESLSRNGLRWPILAAFALLMVVAIQRLGYVEFRAARQLLSRRSMLRAVRDAIYLEELDAAVLRAQGLHDCWRIVRSTCSHLHFASAQMKVHGCTFFEAFHDAADAPCCRIELELGLEDFLLLTRLAETASPPETMLILDRLGTLMRKRLSDFEPVTELVSTSTAA